MIFFINMISLHEIDPFFHPLDDDLLLIVEFVDSSISLLSAYLSCNVCSLPHSPLSEMPYFDLISSIFDLS